jgi:DNA-binding transcriptional MerR regulator
VPPSTDPDDPAGRLLTTAEAAEAAHVPEERIRDWGRRLILLPSDTRDGHPLYRELDVLRAEQRTRRSARTQALLAEAMEGLDSPAT